MGNQQLLEPEVGQTYRLVHTRKGTFQVKVLALDSEWVDVQITGGKAKLTSDTDNLGPGSTFSVRRSFALFYAPGTGL